MTAFEDKKSADQPSGLTLAEYAAAKKLSVDFLRGIGCRDLYLHGKPAVAFPYKDVTGEETVVRFRLAMTKDEERFRWRNGSKPTLYGLWKLQMACKAGYVTLVEGESDCHTLWFQDLPALGIPGANNWKEEWARHLEGIPIIYVVVEPDKGGAATLAWLRMSTIRDRVKIIEIKKAKDPSELYLNDPSRFRDGWNKLIADSRSWSEIEAREKRARVAADWKKCQELAEDDSILERFAEALRGLGAAGISRISKILYLALTSRFLDRIVSIGLKGPSSGGKSFAVESVLRFFPKAAFSELTAMSDKVLAYSEEPLCHRVVVFYEAAALNSEWAAYFMRSLLSENKLIYETVEKIDGQLVARRIEREGPTGLITTTTAVSLHHENETRFFSLRVNDSPDQTRRIIEAEAQKVSGEEELNPEDKDALFQKWQALQSWLEGMEHRVVVRFANAIAQLIPAVAVRLRRDFPAVMSLVRAHALLHQASRKTDDKGRIIATLDDYKIVRELVKGVMAEAAEQTVPHTLRETVRAVSEILHSEERTSASGATILEITNRLGIDRSAALRRVREGIARGFLATPEKMRQGRITHVILGDALPEDHTLLPTIKEIKEQLKH
jgi:hypothetical protein